MIHVVARSSDHLALFNRRHEQLYGRVQFELGQTSFFALLNSVIATDERPYVCLAHDDVTFGSDFPSRVESLISRLNRDWPNWGVVGNTGLLSFRFGFDPTGVLLYVADPLHGPNFLVHVLHEHCIVGNTMLLNVRALRQRGVVLPDWNGFQLYDIVLSIENDPGWARCAGRSRTGVLASGSEAVRRMLSTAPQRRRGFADYPSLAESPIGSLRP